MKYFKPAEFQGWYEQCNLKLLDTLDKFRELWGAPVMISPASGAVGRRLGDAATSQHNIDHWGCVNAVDVMPKGMMTRADMERAIKLAQEAGFTGIGVYPFWHPFPGLHLDVREGAPGVVAHWAGVPKGGKQVYIGMLAGLDLVTDNTKAL